MLLYRPTAKAGKIRPPMSNAPQPNFRPQASSPAAASKPSGTAPSAKPSSAATPIRTKSNAPASDLRRGMYALLITLSVGTMAGRILAVNSVDLIRSEERLKSEAVDQEKQKLQGSAQLAGMTDRQLEDLTRTDWQKHAPFLSANDRSRWLTVRALVEQGTYAIDQYVTDPKTYPNWDTIDMVMHPDPAGTPHLYSSKPPFLATLYAGPYWLIYKISGAIRGTPISLATHPYEFDRAMLLLVNVFPLLIYFCVLAKILDRFGRTDWGRMFVMAAATFGTFITTFAVVLNNHLPAAVGAMVAPLPRCGFGTTGIAAYDISCSPVFFPPSPQLANFPRCRSSCCCWSHSCSKRRGKRSWHLFRPPWSLSRRSSPRIGSLTTVSFHPTLIDCMPKRRRSHRSATASAALETKPESPTVAAPIANSNAQHFEENLPADSGQSVTLRGNPDNWYDYEFTRTDGKLVQSYWRNPEGIDVGEKSIGKYALNVLVGHHGIFSLTPLWLLILPGLILWAIAKDYRSPSVAISIALISAVCIAFYICLPVEERNYGGMTSGFRWIFWLTPFWLLAVVSVADKLSGWLAGRLLGYLLLACSVLSAAYPVWNPWVQPWLWNLWTYLGW